MTNEKKENEKTRDMGDIEAEQLARDLERPGGIEKLNKEAFDQAKKDNTNLTKEK